MTADAPYIILTPCLNEERAIGALVESMRRACPNVLVLDDGSTDRTAGLAREAGAVVHSNPKPRGKGHALRQACALALQMGHTQAILMDGDGQHLPEDIPHLVKKRRTTGAALVVGNRLANPVSMPPIRRWTNQMMSAILSASTGQSWPDTQCGFRALDLAACASAGLQAERFEIESEMLVKFWMLGSPIAFEPIQSVYCGGASHIHPLRDTVRWVAWFLKTRGDLRQAAQPRILPQTAHGSIRVHPQA